MLPKGSPARGRYTLDDIRRAVFKRHHCLVAAARPIGVNGETRTPGVYWSGGRAEVVFREDAPPDEAALLRYFPDGAPALIGGEADPRLL